MISGIVAMENSSLSINSSEIKGNMSKDTIGIVSRWADLNIKSSLIHRNSLGGLLVESHQLNKVEIKLSRIINNGTVGINFIGPLADPKLLENHIENNKEIGVLISVGNKAKIVRNKICRNHIGLQSISAHPNIF
jgi:hypothetical protein